MQTFKCIRSIHTFKKDHQVKKKTKLGAKYVVACPNLFIQYEQNMSKSVIFLNFDHNFYEGWYEH